MEGEVDDGRVYDGGVPHRASPGSVVDGHDNPVSVRSRCKFVRPVSGDHVASDIVPAGVAGRSSPVVWPEEVAVAAPRQPCDVVACEWCVVFLAPYACTAEGAVSCRVGRIWLLCVLVVVRIVAVQWGLGAVEVWWWFGEGRGSL